MSRWSEQVDDPWLEDGDTSFIGYNEKIHRSVLPAGFVAKSINKRFTDQTASPRPGTTMPSGNRFWVHNAAIPKFLGSGLYNNPNAQERLVLAFNLNTIQGVVWTYDFTNDNQYGVALPAGANWNSNGFVWFAQGFDKLIALDIGRSHGNIGSPSWTNGLSWDGIESQQTQHQFQWFQWNSNTEIAVIPPSLYAWPVSNRIAYLSGFGVTFDGTHWTDTENMPLDHIIISDVLGSDNLGALDVSYQSYDYVLADFRINAGEADAIRGVAAYAYDTLVVFKSKSIHLLEGFSIDPTLADQQLITSYLGVSGVRAMVQVGTEIYFMADELGVFGLQEVIEKRLTVPPIALSDPILPIINRINWAFGQGIVAATLDHYLYFAVPLDGATVNNAVLVFNTQSGNWETIDMWAAIPHFAIDNLIGIHINSERRLVAIQNNPPLIYLMYDGMQDQTAFDLINPRFADIPDMIETRGYGLSGDSGPVGFRQFHRGGIVVDTIDPNIKITAITEGVNEEKVVRQSITKNRLKFYPHAHPDFDPIHGDPGEQKRKDYSVATQQDGVPVPNFAAQDFEHISGTDVTDGTIPVAPTTPSPEWPPVGRMPFDPGTFRLVPPRLIPPHGENLTFPFTISITEDDPDAIVIYTLDGSTPTWTNGTHGANHLFLTLQQATTVKAIGAVDSTHLSGVTTGVYSGPVSLDNVTPTTAQSSRERFAIRAVDRWLSLRIENSQGSCRILATSVESTESKRAGRTAA
jgi:hypothetical protein